MKPLDIAALEVSLPGPANPDAERTILGAIFLNNDAYTEISGLLSASDFSLDSHRRIFRRIGELMESQHAVDIVTLAEQLAKNKEIEAVGGVSYLASLTEGLPRRPVIEEYVRIIKDKAMLRGVVERCNATANIAADGELSATSIIHGLEEDLAKLIDGGVFDAQPIGNLTPDVEEVVEKARAVSQDKVHLEMTWGLPELDQKTHGCFRGEFTVVSAESSGGKSAFVTQMALANAREGTPVAIFSLEMEKVVLAKRFYPLISSTLTAKMMRDPRLINSANMEEMRRVSQELRRLPIEIDDSSPLRIDKLKGRIKALWRRRKKQGHKQMLFIIDYLSLVKGMPKLFGQDKTEHIVFTLRDLPKEEPGIHILALSQYSKGETIKRSKNQSRSKDALFWGSVIHHSAQNLLMIRMEDQKDKHPGDLLDVEIMVEKQREGDRGPVRTFYDRSRYKFGQPEPFKRS